MCIRDSHKRGAYFNIVPDKFTFFYIFIQRYTSYLFILLWTDTTLIVNLELLEKFTRWKKPECHDKSEKKSGLSWLESRTGIARSRVQTPLKSWPFQVSNRNCLNCVHNCDDQSLLVWPSFDIHTVALTMKTNLFNYQISTVFLRLPLTCQWGADT